MADNWRDVETRIALRVSDDVRSIRRAILLRSARSAARAEQREPRYGSPSADAHGEISAISNVVASVAKATIKESVIGSYV